MRTSVVSNKTSPTIGTHLGPDKTHKVTQVDMRRWIVVSGQCIAVQQPPVQVALHAGSSITKRSAPSHLGGSRSGHGVPQSEGKARNGERRSSRRPHRPSHNNHSAGEWLLHQATVVRSSTVNQYQLHRLRNNKQLLRPNQPLDMVTVVNQKQTRHLPHLICPLFLGVDTE